MTQAGIDGLLSPTAFVARLRDEGRRRYHHEHPFHQWMHEGKLNREQIQCWVENRYYYQTRVPIKDALIIAKSEDQAFRRAWRHRIADHDGDESNGAPGGLDLWLRLAEGVGLRRDAVANFERVLPGVRFACDAYVGLVRDNPLVVAVASSLTEMFAPDILTRRLEAWEKYYPWVDRAALEYFRMRPPRARRDSEEAIAFVIAHANMRMLQIACEQALVRKTEILWQMLDCIQAEVGPHSRRTQ